MRIKRQISLKKNKLKFLRDYQVKAIQAIKNKIKDGGDRFLLENGDWNWEN